MEPCACFRILGSGRIRAQGIKELVMDASRVDVTKTAVQMQELREAV